MGTHRFLAFHKPRRAGTHRFLAPPRSKAFLLRSPLGSLLRKDSPGQQCNFYIHYEVDDDEVPTVLQIAAYGGEEGCWVLLESVASEVEVDA